MPRLQAALCAPMIPAMSLSLRPLVLLALCLTASCSLPRPQENDSLLTGLGRLGTCTGSADPEVVVVCDRHETHGSVARSSAAWSALRRANNLAVGFLTRRGFTLLGAEAALGPLPDDHLAEIQRTAYEEALASGEDVNSLNLYQPLRLHWEHAPALLVLGVEDPDAYAHDADALQRINALEQAAREGLHARSDADIAIRNLVSSIRERAAFRGRAAAANLHRLMLAQQHPSAQLMLGSAHCAAAVAELQKRGLRVLFFRAAAIDGVLHPAR